MKPSAILPFGSVLAVLLAATLPAGRAEAESRTVLRATTPSMGKHKLIAGIFPSGNGHVEGTVLFERIGGGVRVTARIGGLKPDAVHAIRIQGLSNDRASAGGSKDMLQPGDLGNLMSDKDGNATHVVDLDNRALGTGGILGLTVTVHERAGNGESPDEEAGGPIGAGVIRTAK